MLIWLADSQPDQQANHVASPSLTWPVRLRACPVRAMKLMLLVSSMHSGGAERVSATQCNAWVARGDEVTLVATYFGRGDCEYSLDQRVRLIYLADVMWSAGGWDRGSMHLGRYAGYLGRVLSLRRIIRENRPDAVVSFLTNVNVSAAIATFRLNLPLIVSERTDPQADARGKWMWNVLRRMLYPLADVVTVQTVAGRAVMRSCVPAAKRIEAVANPIPEELVDAEDGDQADFFKTPRRRLIAMGRLTPEKQWDQLIEVFASLAPRHPNVDLWIWGQGEMRPSLERQIAESGLTDRVFLPGRTGSPWREMALGEAFVLTSAYEGFPNVLLEAMALGLPCVAYDCPTGPREITENGTVATLVPLNDRLALEQSLDTLLKDPAAGRSLGRLGSESVKARYHLAAVLARWDEILCGAKLCRTGSSNGPIKSF